MSNDNPRIVFGNIFDLRGLAQSINGQPKALRIASWSFVVGLPVLGIAAVVYGLTRAPDPFPWAGDITPREQWVCDSSPESVEEVRGYDAFWTDLGWPEWPEPIAVSRCPDLAPPGVAMWRACGQNCPEKAGGVRVDWTTMGVTVYTQPAWMSETDVRDCLPLHESGHARGIIDPDDPARHTSAAAHLMADRCGSSLRGLDRTDGGDWPY